MKKRKQEQKKQVLYAERERKERERNDRNREHKELRNRIRTSGNQELLKLFESSPQFYEDTATASN